jgi:hypothetical protein
MPFEMLPLIDGVRFALPRRPLGTARWVAVLLVVVGGGFSIPAIIGLAGFFRGPMQWFHMVSAAFNLLFAVLGLIALGAAWWLWTGRCDVDLTRSHVRLIERAGPFWWSWSRPAEALRKLEVHWSAAKVNGDPVKTGPWSRMAYIKAQFEGHRDLMLAAFYPLDVAESLAKVISQQARLSAPAGVMSRSGPTVEIVATDAADAQADFADAGPPPADANIELVARGDDLTIRVQPLGFWKAGIVRSSTVFTIFWCAFVGLFTVGILVSKVSGSNAVPWFALLLMLPFWAAGVGMAVFDTSMAKRHAFIDIVGDTLLITHQGIWKSRQYEWRCDELAAIRCDRSGFEINDRPAMQLQVHPTQGKKVGFFTGRDEPHLAWLAATLRHRLHVPSRRS